MRVPKYRLHKGSGQAVVEIAGKRTYLGVYESAESKAKYHAIIADYLANGQQNRVADTPNRVEPQSDSITVAQLCDAFDEYALTYYRRADGTLTSEPDNVKQACRELRSIYGASPVDHFTPKDFKRVRDAMVKRKLSRSHINRQCARIKLVFRWGVGEGEVNATTWHGLTAVRGLKYGRCEAKESNPVKPANLTDVEAAKRHCSKQVRAMIDIQLLTGMRPGEVVAMRACDLNTSGKVWTYTPAQHKTQHHGHNRIVYIGPKAQRIIRPYLRRKTDAPMFTPEGNFRHRDGDTYTPSSYRVHVRRACKAAGVSIWHPHQLRHNAATSLRAEFGIEVAQHVLGHRTLTVTEVYAERDAKVAAQAMAKIG